MDGRCSVRGVEESYAIKKLAEELSLDRYKAARVLDAMAKAGLAEVRYDSFGKMPPGCIGMIVRIGKWTFDVSKLSICIIGFILGFTPFGAVAAAMNLLYGVKQSMVSLSEKEQAVFGILSENDERFTVSSLCDWAKQFPLFEGREEIEGILDSLSEKGLIRILASGAIHAEKISNAK